MQNKGTFLRSSFNLDGTLIQMLHFQPCFNKKPVLIRYEISGTDGLINEGEFKITESNLNKQTITFECKLDETYFCKVTGYFNESKTSLQNIRLFYKVENDIDDVIMKSNSQKIGFRKVDDKNHFHNDDDDLPEEEAEDDTEEEPEDEEEDEEEDGEEDDMTLEMRVEQLKKFSNYFSDEE
jgi:hypothetical protein